MVARVDGSGGETRSKHRLIILSTDGSQGREGEIHANHGAEGRPRSFGAGGGMEEE